MYLPVVATAGNGFKSGRAKQQTSVDVALEHEIEVCRMRTQSGNVTDAGRPNVESWMPGADGP